MSNASQIAALRAQIVGWQKQIDDANRQIAVLQTPPPVTPPPVIPPVVPKPRMWVEYLGAGKARVHWADV